MNGTDSWVDLTPVATVGRTRARAKSMRLFVGACVLGVIGFFAVWSRGLTFLLTPVFLVVAAVIVLLLAEAGYLAASSPVMFLRFEEKTVAIRRADGSISRVPIDDPRKLASWRVLSYKVKAVEETKFPQVAYRLCTSSLSPWIPVTPQVVDRFLEIGRSLGMEAQRNQSARFPVGESMILRFKLAPGAGRAQP
jgi:hypothetical protein